MDYKGLIYQKTTTVLERETWAIAQVKQRKIKQGFWELNHTPIDDAWR